MTLAKISRLTVLWAVLVMLAAGLFLPAMAAMERNAYPEFEQYATGRVLNNRRGYDKQNAEIMFGKDPPDDKWQGYATFDLSEIPDNAQIQSVSINYEVISVSDPGPWTYIRLLSLDPLSADAAALWGDITSGTIVTDPIQEVRGWVERPLNASGVAAVQAALAGDKIAFGFHKYDLSESKGHVKGYQAGKHKPYLKIVYAGRDLGVEAIIAPLGDVNQNSSVQPVARINNHGDLDGPFQVVFQIYDGDVLAYYEVLGLSSLAPGQSRDIPFPPFVALGNGERVNHVRVMAAGDDDPDNDQKVEWFNIVSAGGGGGGGGGNGQQPVRWGWEESRSMPLGPSGRLVRHGGWLAVDPGSGMVYAGKGNKSGDFYRYDPIDRSWQELASIPAGSNGRYPGKGARAVVGRDGYLYLIKGNGTLEFWRYSIAGNSWEQLLDIAAGMSNKTVKNGSDVVWTDQYGTGYVYLLKGPKDDFMRYDVEAQIWENLPPPPAGSSARWKQGSWLVYDGGVSIIAHKAQRQELWQYDIVNDVWSLSPRPGIPLLGSTGQTRKSKDGSAGVYRNGELWALKGGKTQEFWSMGVAGRWFEFEPMPDFGSTLKVVRVGSGADLVGHPFGRAFYALKGNKTLEFWRYTMAPEGETQQQAGDPGAAAGPVASPARLSFSVAPNPPLGGIANLNYVMPQRGPASVRIHDASGRVVSSQSVQLESNGSVRLDVSHLSAGVYLVRLAAGEAVAAQKLVIGR